MESKEGAGGSGREESTTIRCRASEKGMALVLTLMVLVIITALVTEFSYGVFTTTSALYNWRDSQRLSFVARSGVALARKTISDMKSELYRFPGKMEIPVENIVEGFTGTVVVRVEDENSRFNMNSLESSAALDAFINLLRNLDLKEDFAYRIHDWIDSNSVPDHNLTDSEEGAKNAYMDSVDELLLIKGIDQQTYEKLRPYVTVYGTDANGNYMSKSYTININTASIPVIMCFNVTKEDAERIIMSRPFVNTGTSLLSTGSLSGNITVKSPNFRIVTVAEENKIKRVIETIININDNGQQTIKYWRET